MLGSDCGGGRERRGEGRRLIAAQPHFIFISLPFLPREGKFAAMMNVLFPYVVRRRMRKSFRRSLVWMKEDIRGMKWRSEVTASLAASGYELNEFICSVAPPIGPG